MSAPPWIEREGWGMKGWPGKDKGYSIRIQDMIQIYNMEKSNNRTPLHPLDFAFRTWVTNTSSAVLFSMDQNYPNDPPYGDIKWTLQIALTGKGLVSRREDHGTVSY
jgi:hypothetical protein